MMIDTASQLAILADALTEIVDLTTAQTKPAVSPDDLLDRMGDIAVEALTAAATYGRLPPFATDLGDRGETLN
jgi:hypothetical protein